MKTILVALDFSDATPLVLDQAVALAKALQAHLTLLHVALPEPEFVGFEPGPEVVRTTVARDLAVEREQLQRWKTHAEKAEVPCNACSFQGSASEKIIAEAERTSAAMIVLGSHGHGALYHLLVGSVAEAVLKRSTVPVVVVPARSAERKAQSAR